MMIDGVKGGHYADDEWTPGPGEDRGMDRDLLRTFLSDKMILIYDFSESIWKQVPNHKDMADCSITGYLRLNT